MPSVSTYLNFMGNAQEAFDHYKAVFGTDYAGPIMRMGDVDLGPNGPQLTDAEKQMFMHAELPILAGHVLMATDLIASAGHELRIGNNTTIHLEVDTKADADRLYAGLSEGTTGEECSPMADMFWGDYWGTCLDRFGIRWMFTCRGSANANA